MEKFKNNQNNQKGFTLVEVMVSVGIFTIIMLISINAILSVNNVYRKSRSMRSAIDNLSFIMEDMARNIRLGHSYRCVNIIGSGGGDIADSVIEDTKDGFGCKGIALEPFWNPIKGDPGDQLVYVLDEDSIFKSIAGGNSDNFNPMNSVDVLIDQNISGFDVFGAEFSDDQTQPTVVIRLAGRAVSNNGRNSTDFNLQITVSQRLLDVNP